ncbi:Probable multidrug resistance-associated protein lethal(2)03659 [Gryllus bimaculatus]|nr:Probable multidrug resistance-associated protein lethal(2)03659 [Gryllus bimaculatus]
MDRSALLGNALEQHWLRQEAAAKRRKGRPNLRTAILKTFGAEYVKLGILVFITDIVLRLAQPQLLGGLLAYFELNSTVQRRDAYLYAGGIVLCAVLNALCANHYLMGAFHTGMRVRAACCALIYRKGALGRTAAGQMVNLLSNDVSRFDLVSIFLHYMWAAPLAGAICAYFMYREVGWPAFTGIAAVFVVVPLQAYTGHLSAKFRHKTAVKTDERVRLMDEIISGIQVIKMYAWEKPFAKLVAVARRLEIRVVTKTSYIRGLYMTFGLCTTRIALACTLSTMAFAERPLPASQVFVVLSYFNILSQTMSMMFVRGIAEVAETIVSTTRLQDFMCHEELQVPQLMEPPSLNGQAGKEGKESAQKGKDEGEDDDVMVAVKGVTARWEPTQPEPTLANVDLAAHRGQLIAVIGHVGAGKEEIRELLAAAERNKTLNATWPAWEALEARAAAEAEEAAAEVERLADAARAAGAAAPVQELLAGAVNATRAAVGVALDPGTTPPPLETKEFAYVFLGVVGTLFLLALTRSLGFYSVAMRCSERLHAGMFRSIIRARMRFFDTNPSGRILNRFSKDIGSVDELLPKAILDAGQIVLMMLGSVLVSVAVNYYFIIPVVIMGVLFWYDRKIYLKTSKNVKRVEGITKSPVFTHLHATLQGLTTVRASGAQDTLRDEFDRHQDLHSSAWFMFMSTSAAFGFSLDVLVLIYITIITFSFLVIQENFGGSVGLAITQAMALTGMMQWGMRQSAEVANNMMSVERVLEYSLLEEEPNIDSPPAERRAGRPNPSDEAGALSTLFFWWTVRLFQDGYSHDLAPEDLCDTRRMDRSALLGNALEQHWLRQEAAAKRRKGTPNLRTSILKTFGAEYALRLSQSALGRTAAGQMVNLLSNDVSRFDQVSMLLHYMWAAPLTGAICAYFMYREVGWPAFTGIAAVFVVVPLQAYLGKMSAKFRHKTAVKTDERVRLMDEIISGIQVIKMYAWEKPFAKLVAVARRQEIRVITKTSYIRGLYMTFTQCTTRIALACTLCTMAFAEQPLLASQVFVVLSYFNVLSQTMSMMFVRGVTEVAETIVSITRLQDFMCHEELQVRQLGERPPLNGKEGKESAEQSKGEGEDDDVMVAVKGVTARWEPTQPEPTLANVDLEAHRGQLIAQVSFLQDNARGNSPVAGR